ncbi:hypothetical protein [Romboutsia sp.]|uniref:hypothetical protein n=1 Tax=Romboutsia sp. TaxID=1965302 RepID=UPI003F3301D2
MRKIEKYGLGTIHENRYGEKFEIIGKCDRTNYRVVRFLEPYQYINEVDTSNIIDKKVKNPYRKSVYNIGCLGEGIDFNRLKCNSTHPLYSIWSNMINRCYNPKHTKYPIYGAKGVKVCNEWHNFSYFVEDILEMYNGSLLYESYLIKDYKGDKWALDKDSTNSKIYSKYTVKIIPMKLNSGMSRMKDEDRKSKLIQEILDNEKPTNWVCAVGEGISI